MLLPPTPQLRCAPNFRHLGGLPTTNGGHVRHGKLFRSDYVDRPDDLDAQALDRCLIELVFDLRSATEVASHPNIHWASRNAEVLAFDIGTDVRAKGSFWETLREDSRPEQVVALMHRIYRSIPLAVAPALRILFDRAVEANPPTMLLHCAVGKDRTGVAVALLLHALGVVPEAIETDYLETSSRLTEAGIMRARENLSEVAGAVLEDASLRYLTHPDPAFLAQSWSWIDRKYGGVDAFLEVEAGLHQAKRAALRSGLVVQPGSQAGRI